MKDKGKWDRLSANAKKILHRENNELTVGHSVERVCKYLGEAGCPPYGPFVNYLTNYAGISLCLSNGDGSNERVYLRSITDNNPTEAIWYDPLGEWHLYCSGSDNSHVSVEMRPDGELVCYHGNRKWSRVIASSIELFLEDLALRVALGSNDEYAKDCISTSYENAAALLANSHRLLPLSEATDQYIQWWSRGSVWIGCSPSGHVHPTMKKRITLRAYWSQGNNLLDDQITQELTELLEPHLGAFRKLDGFREYRTKGLSEAFFQKIMKDPGSRPATSFRLFAQRELAALSQTFGRILSPPDRDALFCEYLGNCLAAARQTKDSNVIYYAAVGLAALGNKELIDDILVHLPREAGSCWCDSLWAGQYLGYLMPVNFQACPVDETEEARGWLRTYFDKLYWNEEQGKYTLV